MIHHPAHVVLIDETGQVSSGDLARYAAAANEDIAVNFAPVWGAHAIVTVATDETKPVHAWAVKIQAQLDQPGALGYHTDALNQPVSFVELTDNLSVTISHELKEMLADPSGNRLRTAGLPAGLNSAAVGCRPGDLVRYLLEVADPPETVRYKVLGVPQSDFIFPAWYRSFSSVTTGYSFAGGCPGPRIVAVGGYCSFARSDDEWFQVFNQGGGLQVSDLGKFTSAEGARSLREWADSKAREWRSR